MKNKSVRQTINRNAYYIKTREWFWGKSVKVSDTGDSWGKNKPSLRLARNMTNKVQTFIIP